MRRELLLHIPLASNPLSINVGFYLWLEYSNLIILPSMASLTFVHTFDTRVLFGRSRTVAPATTSDCDE